MTHILVYSDCAGQYGAEQVNHRLAMGLHAAGYRVSFAQPYAAHALIDERQALGIAHYWLPEERLYDLSSPAPSLRDAGPAATIIGTCAPDLVLFADGCPLSSLAAKEYCAVQDIAFVALVHCVFAGWQQDYAAHLSTLALCYRWARDVIAVSADNLQLLRNRFGLPGDKGRVIYNGRPDKYFSPRDSRQRAQLRGELGLGEDSILCLAIGRMEWVKGFQYQLYALAKLVRQPCWDALHFLWIGGGTQQRSLLRGARLLAGNKLTHVESHHDIPRVMAASDIFVHTAQYEGMPLVILEAMARGLPVIATAVSGVPEALGETGVLLSAPHVSTDLPREIADAVCSLALDAPERSRLGQAAAHRAQILFREDTMLQHYLELMATVTAGAA